MLTLLNNSVFSSGTFIRPAFFVAFVFITNLLNKFVRKMYNIKYINLCKNFSDFYVQITKNML